MMRGGSGIASNAEALLKLQPRLSAMKLVNAQEPDVRAAAARLLDDYGAYVRMARYGLPYRDGRAALRIVQCVRACLRLPPEHEPLSPFEAADA